MKLRLQFWILIALSVFILPLAYGFTNHNSGIDGSGNISPAWGKSVKVYDSTGTNYTEMKHDGTNAVFDTTAGGFSFLDQILAPDGSKSIPSYGLSSDTNTGFYKKASGTFSFSSNGQDGVYFGAATNPSVIQLALDTGFLAWGVNADVRLYRDAAAVLAQRNGTNAQEFRVYNKDSGSNDEFASMGWINNANEFTIATELTGTGTARNMRLQPAANGVVLLSDTGTKPTCAVGIRGALWYEAAGAGVKDDVQICAKDSSDVYNWRVIY